MSNVPDNDFVTCPQCLVSVHTGDGDRPAPVEPDPTAAAPRGRIGLAGGPDSRRQGRGHGTDVPSWDTVDAIGSPRWEVVCRVCGINRYR
jgi:hypothetical protein